MVGVDGMNNTIEGSLYELSLTYHNATDHTKDELITVLHKLFPLFIEKTSFFEHGKGIVTSIKTNDYTYKCEISWIIDGNISWLDLSIPSYQFEELHQVNYPFLEEENEWLAALNDQLYSIALHLYEVVPCIVAVIGEEVGGLLEEVPFSTPFQTICFIPKGNKLIHL